MPRSSSAGLLDPPPSPAARCFQGPPRPETATRGGVTALGLAAALALGTGEAAAQPVFQCPAASPPVTAVFPPGFDLSLLTADHLRAVFRAAGPVVIPTEPVDCGFVNHEGTRNVVVRNPRITVNEDLYAGISAWRQGGNGDLVVYVHGVDAAGEPQHFHPIDHGRYAVRTMGDGEWNVGEESYGVWASHTGRGRVAIDFRDLSLSTAGGDAAHGIYATQQGSYFYENEKTHRSRGAVIVNVIETERDREGRVRPLVGTRGDESDAIRAEYTRAAAYGHIAVTVKGYTIATGGIVPPGPQSPNNQGVPGVEPGPLLPSLNGYESRGIHALHEGLGDIRIAVTDSHILTWGDAAQGILANHTGRLETITNLDRTTEVRTGGGAIDIDVAGGEIRTAGANSIGIHGWHRGAGDVVIDATEATIATTGEEAHGVLAHIRQATTTEGDRITGTETEAITGTGEGDVAISVTGGAISTEGEGAYAVWGRHEHEGDIAVSVSGGATVATAGAKTHAVFAEHLGTEGNVAVTVGGGAIATAGAGAHGVHAKNAGSGAVTVAVTGGSVTAEGEESHAVLALQSGAGVLNVRVTGGTVTAKGAESHGIEAHGGGDVTVAVDGGSVAAQGAGGAGVLARSIATQEGEGAITVSVGAGGTVSAASGIAIYSDGPDDLNVKVAGRVEGDIFHSGDGVLVLELPGGGVVTGTVHDPRGPLTVHGSIGRLFYSDGATVTVAPGGKLTGVEVELEGVTQTQAIRSLADDLSVTVQDGGAATGHIIGDGDGSLTVTVQGSVDGDILQSGPGALMLNIPAGGVISGTVHDPASPLTVGGSVGRLLYGNGGTVTVAGTGRITGVEGIAIHATAGDLRVAVDKGGEVKGDVRADTGRLTLKLLAGSTVEGTIRNPADLREVHGTIGRLLYDNGGTITVTGTGRLTGVEIDGKREAIRSEAGDLAVTVAADGEVEGDIRAEGDGDLTATISGRVEGDVLGLGAGEHMVTVTAGGEVEGDIRAEGDGDLTATISGRVEGDVLGLGAGEHTVTVKEGGAVTGTIHLAASTARVYGAAGRVRFDNGGMVTVGGTGRITGIERVAIRNAAGDLDLTVARGGEVGGDIRALGDGHLTATISGTVTGDVLGLGKGRHTVTVGEGGAVKGTLHFDGGVNRVELHEGGRIESREGRRGRAISNEGGTLEVVVRAAGEEAAFDALNRIEGSLYDHRGLPEVRLQRAGKDEALVVGPFATRTALADGAHDVGLSPAPGPGREGEYVFRRELYAPRARVYEALPSVVLGMNGLPGFRERMSAPRSAKGGWARVEGFRGKWKADASTSGKESGLQYRHRRHGIEVGWAVALGEEARFGASLHHRRGTAKVTEGGDVELYGTGVGASGTWMRDEFYVDAQAAMTGYEADLGSSRRGVLRKDLSGHGHVLGVEAGRRLALEGLPAGVVLTPRAGLVHSRVSMGAFSDAVGSRVSVDDARSLRGRVGVEAEVKPGGAPGSRVFASVEVEHEFSTDRKVRVSGTEETELRSEAEATWLRLGLNGVYAWEEGRYTLQGGVSYATSGGSHETGGRLSLKVRF